jgi:anti-sigma28 factor (negative regulator of flagellin synthesis)
MNTMRVDQRNLTGAAEAGRAREMQSIGRDGRSISSANSGGSGSDQVELSSLSRALHASANQRSARVEQLAAQYQGGEYQPDPAEISKSMVSEALTGSSFQ